MNEKNIYYNSSLCFFSFDTRNDTSTLYDDYELFVIVLFVRTLFCKCMHSTTSNKTFGTLVRAD